VEVERGEVERLAGSSASFEAAQIAERLDASRRRIAARSASGSPRKAKPGRSRR
jgi:hypothetical protein